MEDLILSWSTADEGGHVADFEWADVEAKLLEVCSSQGTVTLDVKNPDIPCPVSLQVRSDRGFHHVTLGEETTEDYDVRTLFDVSRRPGRVTILGDDWDNRCICEEVETVCSIFAEFFEHRQVGDELLS